MPPLENVTWSFYVPGSQESAALVTLTLLSQEPHLLLDLALNTTLGIGLPFPWLVPGGLFLNLLSTMAGSLSSHSYNAILVTWFPLWLVPCSLLLAGRLEKERFA